MINKDTGEYHVVGGDCFPGEGDTGYIGLDILERKFQQKGDKQGE